MVFILRVWFISLTMASSGCIHIVMWVRPCFLVKAVLCSITWLDHTLFIPALGVRRS